MLFSFTKNNKHAPVGYIMCVAISDVKSSHLYLYSAFTFTFTFMHLADAFIQSDLQCIQVIHLYCQYVFSIVF